MRQVDNRVRQIEGGGDALHLEGSFLLLLILVLCTCVFIVSFCLFFMEWPQSNLGKTHLNAILASLERLQTFGRRRKESRLQIVGSGHERIIGGAILRSVFFTLEIASPLALIQCVGSHNGTAYYHSKNTGSDTFTNHISLSLLDHKIRWIIVTALATNEILCRHIEIQSLPFLVMFVSRISA